MSRGNVNTAVFMSGYHRALPLALLLLISVLSISGCGRSDSEADSSGPQAQAESENHQSAEDAAAAHPLDADAIARNNRGVAMMGTFDYSGAQNVFESLVNEHPGWIDARLNLAIATLNRQQPNDETVALGMAQSVMEQDPDNLRAHYIAGILAFNAGDISAALANFKKVVDDDPKDAHAQYFFAQSLAQQGQFGDALSGYEKAIELDPYLRSAYYGAFTAAQRLGNREQAKGYLEDYQRLANNPRATLAEIKYTRMGEKAMALAVPTDSPTPAAPKPEGALFSDGEILATGLTNSRNLTLGDLDGDGNTDLLIDGQLWLAGTDEGLQSGEPTPLIPQNKIAGPAVIGDINNDGINDLFVFSPSAGELWYGGADGWRAQGFNYPAQDALMVDADHDGDLDLLLASANGQINLLNNNRDGTFRSLAGENGLKATADRLLVSDLDSDRDQDLLLVGEAGNTTLLNDRLWNWRMDETYSLTTFPPMKSVLAGDLNADGIKELYGLPMDGGVVVLTHDGDRWAEQAINWPDAVLPRPDWMALVDADGNGQAELWLAQNDLGWQVLSLDGPQGRVLYSVEVEGRGWTLSHSEKGPGMLALAGDQVSHWPPGPGRHAFVQLRFSGAEDEGQSMRSNASGIGTQVALRVGSRWSLDAVQRYDSGPGASLLPLQIGLGGAGHADYVAIEWSDGVYQTELDIPAGEKVDITETQRQLASCPVIFAWNGERFEFVSDVLGVGGLGFAVGRGEYATPRPWERFLLPEQLLVGRNGSYEFRFTEPMEELAYLDAVSLVAYDLPPGWNMLLDERMGTGTPAPTGEAWYYQQVINPTALHTAGNSQALDRVIHTDGRAVDPGAPSRRFLGFLENPLSLEVGFGNGIDAQDMTPILIMDGWVEYGYSQTGFAAWQAGVHYQPPSLELQTTEGWQTWHSHFGYPAGMPRQAALPLPGLPEDIQAMRLTTNQEIYFDRLGIALATQDLPVTTHELPLTHARVAKTGFPKRRKLAQRRPHYDYSQRTPFWDTRYPAGFYTQLGPAMDLVSQRDDALAIIGPGEEIQLRFDADLPALRAGWSRRFVLEFHGWAKDMDLYTRDGETVGPLPESGLDKARADQLHARYNIRYQSGR